MELTADRICPNCDHVANSPYCSNCGQHQTEHNAGLKTLLHEFLDEFFRLDSKLLRTLGPLVARPGFLTCEWSRGKRIRYISPLKLYITLSALFFLVISMRFSSMPLMHVTRTTPTEAAAATTTASNPIANFINRRSLSLSRADPAAVTQKFIGRLPTTNFFLIPVFAVLFHVLFWNRRRFYVENLVFTLHYYAFGFAALAISMAMPFGAMRLGAAVWILVYLALALKRNYEEGWISTLAKLVVFHILSIFILVFAVAITLFISAGDLGG